MDAKAIGLPKAGEGAEAFPWVTCALLMLLGAALRLWQIGDEALFYDEYMTPDTAMTPGLLGFFRHVWFEEPHPPLFFLLMRPWITFFGDSAASLRIPAALFGVALIWSLMRFVWETGLGGRRVATLLVGALATVDPFLIYYSQEARPYTMQVFLFSLNAIYLLRLWRGDWGAPARGALWGVIVTATLGVLTHYHTIFLLILDCAALGLMQARAWREGHVPSRRALAAVAWFALMGLGIWWHGSRVGSQTEWISWIPRWQPSFVWYQWIAFSEGPFDRVCPKWLLAVSLAGWLGAFLAAGVPEGESRRRAAPGLIGLMWLALLALPHAVSTVHPLVLFGHRYMVIAVPGFLILTALPFAWSRRRVAQLVCLAVFLVPAGVYLTDYYRHPQKRQWNSAAEVLLATLEPGDVVWYHAPFGDGPLLHYLPTGHFRVLVARTLDRFSAAPAAARRIALVSADPKALAHPAPLGFRCTWNRVYRTGRPKQQLFVQAYGRGR